jgi:hypothetical protein
MPRQTLVTKYFSPSKHKKEPPRDNTTLHSIRQELNHITRERERMNFPKRGTNFSRVVLSEWESYDENEIEIILIYTNPLKSVCPLKFMVNHKVRGQKPLLFPFTTLNLILHIRKP